MRRFLPLLLLLSGCYEAIEKLPGKEFQVRLPIMTWANQYVVDRSELRTSGVFCKWPDDRCNVILADMQYEMRTGKWTNAALVEIKRPGIQSTAPVPYDVNENACLMDPLLKDLPCSPNFVVKALGVNDPLLLKQWGLTKIGGNKAANKIGGLPGPLVAVLDTGIKADHEDLSGQVVSCFDAVTGVAGTCSDLNTHGTNCAGIIAAKRNNAIGISGICPNCKLMGIKFLGANGSGSIFDAIKGIDYAIQNGARVINASFGGGGYSAPFREAVKRANAKGVLIVAAAGNSGLDTDSYPSYPASYDEPNVLSIAATDEKGKLASFSNFGKESVDIAAPGTNILSSRNDGGYGSASGTSFSAPAVAGLAGLILSQEPTASIERIKERIFSGIKRNKRLKGKMRYNGTINAYRSLK